MKIYLMRHGETTGDEENRYGGDYDDHLSQNGKEQVNNLAKKLEGKDIEIIYHSSLIRAIETAQIVGEKLSINLIEIKGIKERNHYGELTGLTKKEAKEKFPDEVEELEHDPIYHKLPHSEDYYEFAERVINAFNEISESEHEIIAIVTHGGPIKIIFRELIGFEVEGLEDCAIIEIEKEGDNIEIIGMDGIESITPN
ncbi:MAG: histidine phosphatase family protein [Candidatus Diapherotrites archaeon]|jgi:broad specificity phosphatase PhoE|uniref:Histidine phosphatase family protein n=1 Tax=Candidatus Iainarchaeum sp. TaxID=3101447 RepID=A0A8T5GF14_9ARCH|nr:histidine phosphatase family protein [Candidatus Diapherotrites archaeon]MBT7241367.1 histidine phosphatase family protein [Candidatus Diapherotrites archaeon]